MSLHLYTLVLYVPFERGNDSGVGMSTDNRLQPEYCNTCLKTGYIQTYWFSGAKAVFHTINYFSQTLQIKYLKQLLYCFPTIQSTLIAGNESGINCGREQCPAFNPMPNWNDHWTLIRFVHANIVFGRWKIDEARLFLDMCALSAIAHCFREMFGFGFGL